MLYPRNLTPNLLAALGDTPVVVLIGARQTGKSTLALGLRGAMGGTPISALWEGEFEAATPLTVAEGASKYLLE